FFNQTTLFDHKLDRLKRGFSTASTPATNASNVLRVEPQSGVLMALVRQLISLAKPHSHTHSLCH
ncbi:hypothetical protein, partial [Rheinheimera maricola]|uniref:hypothetical protein n=1 Tax=Rheinheimera maricola TaxID=2793282 RepID=UPI0019632C53